MICSRSKPDVKLDGRIPDQKVWGRVTLALSVKEFDINKPTPRSETSGKESSPELLDNLSEQLSKHRHAHHIKHG